MDGKKQLIHLIGTTVPDRRHDSRLPTHMVMANLSGFVESEKANGVRMS